MSAPRVRLLYVVRTESASKKDKYLTQPRQNSAFPMAIAAAYYLCLPKDLENKQKCGEWHRYSRTVAAANQKPQSVSVSKFPPPRTKSTSLA